MGLHRVLILPLLLLGALGGCPQPTTEPPQPPPAIYVAPPSPAPTADDEPGTSPPSEDPCPDCAQAGDPKPSGPTFTPSDPSAPSDQPDFKGTLEGIPGEPRADGRDGVAGAGTCEGGARQVGERWKVKCNTCSCEPSGEIICTLMACISGDDV